MLTLTAHKDNQEILSIVPSGKSKKKTPLYWHPIKNLELRNSMESLDYFFMNEDFRDRFQLNRDESAAIKDCLANDAYRNGPEREQAKNRV